MPGNQFYGYLGRFSWQQPTESGSPIQGLAQRDRVFNGHRGQLLLCLTSWLPRIRNSVGYSHFINKYSIVCMPVFPLLFEFKDFISGYICWWTLPNLTVTSNLKWLSGLTIFQDLWLFTKEILPVFSSQVTGQRKRVSGVFFHKPYICAAYYVPAMNERAGVSALAEFLVRMITRHNYLKTTG